MPATRMEFVWTFKAGLLILPLIYIVIYQMIQMIQMSFYHKTHWCDQGGCFSEGRYKSYWTFVKL